MSQVRVVVDDSTRAKYIAIGMATIVVLTFLWFEGAFSFLSSVFIPKPKSEGLMSTWEVGRDLAADAVYMIGVVVASIFSGIGSLVMALIKRVSGTPAVAVSGEPAITKAILDARTRWILGEVKKGTEELFAKVDVLEKQAAASVEVKAATTVRSYRKKTPAKAEK